jgi:hypothetical protein
LAHLQGATADRLKGEGNVAGSVLENFVLMELRKQCAWSATRPEPFYWRTVSGGSNDVGGLQALASAVGKNWVRGVVLYAGAETIPFSEICTVFLSADFGRLYDRGRERLRLPIRQSSNCGAEPSWIIQLGFGQ